MPIQVVQVKTVDVELIVACRTMKWKIINFNMYNGPSAQQTKPEKKDLDSSIIFPCVKKRNTKFTNFKGLHVLHFAILHRKLLAVI